VAIGADGREGLALAYIAAMPVAPGDLQAYVRGKLGPQSPAIFVPVTELPRTLTGKVQRDQLRNLYLDGALG
jgi:acyl-coenzyme A synthetase/AMP-(fatty) acid ligase